MTGASLAGGAVTSTAIADGAVSSSDIADGAIGAADLDLTSIGLWSVNGADVFRSSGKVGIGTAVPEATLQVGDASVPGSEGLVRLGARTAFGGAEARTWDIGVPNGGADVTGKFYSFIIDDTALGTDPEFMVQWGTGNVGIGTTSPSEKLHVTGGKVRVDGKININDGGFSDTAFTAKMSGTDEEAAVFLNSSGSPLVVVSDPAVSSNLTLSVVGDAAKTGGGTWAVLSDARAKNVTGEFAPGLAEIAGLRPVHYRYKEGNTFGYPSDRTHCGFVAQEVRKVIPEAVIERDDGYLMLDLDPIYLAGIHAIQQLKQEKDAEIAELTRELVKLKEKDEARERRLNAIEELLRERGPGAVRTSVAKNAK